MRFRNKVNFGIESESEFDVYDQSDSLACILCGRMTCLTGCCEQNTTTSNIERSYLLKLSFCGQDTYNCKKCGAQRALRVLFDDYK